MSHYCVAVISKEYIGENVFSLLEPFDEAKDVAYQDCTEEVLNAWNTGKTEYGTEIDRNEYENNIEKFACEYFGYRTITVEGSKKYGYWFNPNAKWDWYSIGGRWNNLLKLKCKDKSNEDCSGIINLSKVEYANSAKIKDVDFSLDKKQYDTSKRFWELYVEDDELTNEEERELKSSGFYTNFKKKTAKSLA